MNSAPYHGLLVIDKPKGITSRKVVDRAQRWFPKRTGMGHAGTLDPLATGVLVLCVGVATRLTEYVQRMAKTYRATVRLGARSDTDDADGSVSPVMIERPPDRSQVEACVRRFEGEIEQLPPVFSAVKVAGRRAYELARKGEEVDVRPRRVRIDGIEVQRYEYPELDLEVRCGQGTYIRSLARDLGERLGCGGLIAALRRTRIGAFSAERALSLEADAEVARQALLPVSAAVSELPRLTLDERQVARLRRGGTLLFGDLPREVVTSLTDDEFAVFDAAGRLGAIARVDTHFVEIRPHKVLADLVS